MLISIITSLQLTRVTLASRSLVIKNGYDNIKNPPPSWILHHGYFIMKINLRHLEDQLTTPPNDHQLLTTRSVNLLRRVKWQLGFVSLILTKLLIVHCICQIKYLYVEICRVDWFSKNGSTIRRLGAQMSQWLLCLNGLILSLFMLWWHYHWLKKYVRIF